MELALYYITLISQSLIIPVDELSPHKFLSNLFAFIAESKSFVSVYSLKLLSYLIIGKILLNLFSK